MNGETAAMLAEIRLHWYEPRSDSVMRIVEHEIKNGAELQKSYPSIREMKVVLPRRLDATIRGGLGYQGFEEVIKNIDSFDDDGRLLSYFLISGEYLFNIYFFDGSMKFVGCLHGSKVGLDPPM